MPNFTNSDGTLSDDGRTLIEFIEAQFYDADKKNNIEHLNSLPGMIQHYYINVYKMKAMEAERWVKDFSRSFAANAWALMEYVDEQAAKDAAAIQTTDKVGELTEALAQLQEELKAVRAELAESKAPAKKATKKAVKEAEVVEEEEAEKEPEEEVDPDAETQQIAPDADETED